MIGAVGVTLATGGGITALGPVVIGLLAASIGYGRGRTLPRETSERQIALQLAAYVVRLRHGVIAFQLKPDVRLTRIGQTSFGQTSFGRENGPDISRGHFLDHRDT